MTDNLIYKSQSASESDIANHLLRCNSNFIPPLSERLNIFDYATKIINHSITFEAWSGHNLVGLIATYVNDANKNNSFITNVSVISEYQGRGIALQLIRSYLVYVSEKGFDCVRLEVDKKNLSAINLYQKVGFIEEQEFAGKSMMIKKLNKQ